MKLEIDKAWFEKRAKLEGDHEIGAGGTGGRPQDPAPSQVKAMLLAMAAVPGAACLQVLALILAFGVASEGVGPAEAVLGTSIMFFPTLVLAYVIGAIPTLLGGLLIYPILRANHSALTEYLAAVVLGGLVMVIHAVLFDLPGFAVAWMVGIIPAMTGVYVYRIVLPRAAA